jgi:fumarate hydratase class I
MDLKKTLNTKIFYDVIYNLCKSANTVLPYDVYKKLQNADIEPDVKAQILKNAYLANKTSRPLCQDCGQVVFFLDLGQDIALVGDYIEDVINKAVEDCYKKNFLRKSVVEDAIKNRTNTGTNTPCIIHTKIIKGDEIKILLALKGGGAENTSQLKMFNPTADITEIYDFIKQVAFDTHKNACPPMSLGVGTGGTIEVAAMLAKRALYEGEDLPLKIDDVFEVKMLSAPTHIANLPVCVNTNCHSARHTSATIKASGDVQYHFKDYDIKDVEISSNAQKIHTSEIEKIKKLVRGDKILLSGTILTARDQAHKRLCDMIEKGEKLPVELNNAIIFYCGPAPKKEGEVIGPLGPTTSKRMDKFAPLLYKKGVIATIGKGERTIKEGRYLTVTGGVACLLKECVKKCKTVAFEDLGAEAIYELEIENMPLTVDIA